MDAIFGTKAQLMIPYQLFPERPRTERGNREAELERIGSMIAWSAALSKGPLFRHKLHKMLFYSDRLFYEKQGKSMSGLAYIFGELGPVPERADLIYEVLVLHGCLQKREIRFPASDYFGTAFQEGSAAPFRCLEEEERRTLEEVTFAYKQATPAMLIEECLRDPGFDKLPFLLGAERQE